MIDFLNLGEVFENISKKYPENIALLNSSTNDYLTYKDLNTLSSKIALNLSVLNLNKGDILGVFHNKSPEAFALLIACLKLGVCYVILDPDSPNERLKKIIKKCNLELIINSFAINNNIEESDEYEIKDLKSLIQESNFKKPTKLIENNVNGSDPAYIMFTSGSTGHPKGAVISHSNLLSFITWAQRNFEVSSEDVFTNINPIYFDNSVFDFYISIFSGAKLVSFIEDQIKKPKELINLIIKNKCSIWFSVPSLLVYLLTTKSLDKNSFKNIRKIIFGGEGFPKTKLKELYILYSSCSELINVYGPTECTCICSSHRINDDDFQDMKNYTTLGKLSENFNYKILPHKSPDNECGELILFGPQVGLGYFNDLDKTRNSFIQNPENEYFREFGYKTGDLVSKDNNSFLYFQGRVDFQIKHMGYRIEIEEIENAINSFVLINECAVSYKKINDFLGKIVAYISPAENFDMSLFKENLSKIIPKYMIPNEIKVLKNLPKNRNGKIDRKILSEY